MSVLCRGVVHAGAVLFVSLLVSACGSEDSSMDEGNTSADTDPAGEEGSDAGGEQDGDLSDRGGIGTNELFVSALDGDDDATGSALSPFASLSVAIDTLGEDGGVVYVTAGSYSEEDTIEVPSDVRIEGELNPETWETWADQETDVFVDGDVALLVEEVDNVQLVNVNFHSGEGSRGATSYAARVRDATNIVLRGVELFSGKGGQGDDGEEFTFDGVADPLPGEDGELACTACAGCVEPAVGTGAVTGCGGSGGDGGRPGFGAEAGADGMAGSGPLGGAGGIGVPYGESTTDEEFDARQGGRGGDGAAGRDGDPVGPGFDRDGVLLTWGGGGESGQSGGGGGGAGGFRGSTAPCDAYGDAGSGGGAGGCAGVGGGGGQNGGSSVALFVWSSSLSMEDVRLVPGQAGHGGVGGAGTEGRRGSQGGDLAGAGGNGGAGGYGAGGSGGWSIGLLHNSASTIESQDVRFDDSVSGAGEGGTSQGNAGGAGEVHEVYEFEAS